MSTAATALLITQFATPVCGAAIAAGAAIALTGVVWFRGAALVVLPIMLGLLGMNVFIQQDASFVLPGAMGAVAFLGGLVLVATNSRLLIGACGGLLGVVVHIAFSSFIPWFVNAPYTQVILFGLFFVAWLFISRWSGSIVFVTASLGATVVSLFSVYLYTGTFGTAFAIAVQGSSFVCAGACYAVLAVPLLATFLLGLLVQWRLIVPRLEWIAAHGGCLCCLCRWRQERREYRRLRDLEKEKIDDAPADAPADAGDTDARDADTQAAPEPVKISIDDELARIHERVAALTAMMHSK